MGIFEWVEKVDKITNSIEEVATGKSFDTDVFEVSALDLKTITKTNGWGFNWKEEFKKPDTVIYKLTLSGSREIQGLISAEKRQGFIFMPLIESAPHNRGRDKKFAGVLGNLTAFICKAAFENGCDGIVSFEAKTQLIQHYKKTLGATQIGLTQKMFIDTQQSRKLVSSYYQNYFS